MEVAAVFFVFFLVKVHFPVFRRLSHSVQRSRSISFRHIPDQRLDWQHWYLSSLTRNQLPRQVTLQCHQPNVVQIYSLNSLPWVQQYHRLCNPLPHPILHICSRICSRILLLVNSKLIPYPTHSMPHPTPSRVCLFRILLIPSGTLLATSSRTQTIIHPAHTTIFRLTHISPKKQQHYL